MTNAWTPDLTITQTHIVPSTEPPSGVGEPGTPPAGPALANAIAAFGLRATRLPLTAHDVSFA